MWDNCEWQFCEIISYCDARSQGRKGSFYHCYVQFIFIGKNIFLLATNNS